MNWFPQIGSGSLVQLPLHRRRRWRAVSNELEGGDRIATPDAAGGVIEWKLSYKDLSDTEAASLNSLFVQSKGGYLPFAFADPIANLLAWSEDLSHPDWQSGQLTKSGGASDPAGTQRAWLISNGAAGVQALSQTVNLFGSYVACLSVWMRSDSNITATLQRDGLETGVPVGPEWKRAFLSGTGNSGSDTTTVSIAIDPGQSLTLWGLQLEAQPYPSQYKQTTGASRIYPETYFGSDEITMTSTGVGLSACEIQLVSRI